jgi:hypothetical protein
VKASQHLLLLHGIQERQPCVTLRAACTDHLSTNPRPCNLKLSLVSKLTIKAQLSHSQHNLDTAQKLPMLGCIELIQTTWLAETLATMW